MFSFATPIWLLGLLTIPVIRWMHRYTGENNVVSVSSLLLWPQQHSNALIGYQKNYPDPVWILRALIVFLIFTALAQPQWHSKQKNITVWVDLSTSMFTLESGITRIESGFNQLLVRLEQHKNANITLRSIAKPQKSLSLELSKSKNEQLQFLKDWTKESLPNNSMTFNYSLSTLSNHWLLTDGADKNLATWFSKNLITRLIHVGNERENVSVSRLSVRPSLVAANSYKVMVEITNHGIANAMRTLRLSLDDSTVSDRPLAIPPGTHSIQEYKLNTDINNAISAYILPADSLTVDDKLTLLIPENITKITLSSSCARHLRSALTAMPWTQLITDSEDVPDLFIGCGEDTYPNTSPQIIFHSGSNPSTVKGVPRWNNQTGTLKHLFIDSSWINAFKHIQDKETSTPILQALDEPLITRSENGNKSIHVWIDINTSALIQKSVFPALIAGLIELAVDKPVIEHTLHTSNPANESDIAPHRFSVSKQREFVIPESETTKLEFQFIILCILLLCIDIALANKIIFRKNWRRAG